MPDLLHHMQHKASGKFARHAFARDEAKCKDQRTMNLARIRNLRGLSQRALADMIGVDPSTVHRTEVMHDSAKLSTYQACADALDISLADLFTDDLAPVDREFLRLFRSIPPEKHDALRAALALAQVQPAQDNQ
jgi:transcriptional regulator with XRE-family HTH domain